MNADSAAADIVARVVAMGDPERAASSLRFFKTGPGEYGEGDRFVGVRVPALRTLARSLRGLPAATVVELLSGELHEVRMLALLVVAENYRMSEPEAWVELYREAIRAGRVNNWDLVDCSAATILGDHLCRGGDHTELLRWASSDDLWERRVGIVGTHAFIIAGRSEAILAVAPLVVDDRRDLIQKALGWMLREMGKRVDETTLLDYLEANAARMGRTALSYSVERLSKERRSYFRGLRS
ncbi:DNA alkylation repair protein [Gordonia neofelifaecis]|uniref:DNA alkylation repair enzyme n=1 Tax=Gordonia neofelifaecis NRRL B-59395 TaxID=644548 RepID=F1YNW5_9ACTN|nr:DNA alkylation repair protein [Gordonia neofelifaecis]EGD53584.1 DNA alkylation repair enzyme [Gordonia neofelifaecis NRRL B-59395]